MIPQIIIQIIVSVIVSIIGIMAIKYSGIQKAESIQGKIDTIRNASTKEKIYIAVMVLFDIAISILLTVAYKENTILFNLKRITLVSILWIVAYYDYKSYRIPNKAVLLGLSYRGIILIFEIFFAREFLIETLISEIVAVITLFIVSILCMLLIKNAIGMGDIKLFIVIGLMLGMTGIMTAIGTSLFVSFFAAIYLLMSKKKTRKDSIPFAPCILLGTLFAIVALGA